jgi:O-6-methylguanine DNA methyltransferase
MIQVYAQNIKGTWFALACAEQQIFGTSFGETEQKALNSVLSNLPFNMPFQVLITPTEYAKSAFNIMEHIFEGKDTNLNLNIAIDKMPSYTKRVLKATMQIPIGYVTSYGSIAKTVGGGPRAVGNIMAGNVFAPIVPCHRVVKSDFTLGGYGGGLKMKYHLLIKEKRGFSKPVEVRLDDSVMQVFPVEFALKNACFL